MRIATIAELEVVSYLLENDDGTGHVGVELQRRGLYRWVIFSNGQVLRPSGDWGREDDHLLGDPFGRYESKELGLHARLTYLDKLTTD